MTRYYRKSEGGLSRLAGAGGLLVLFVFVLLVGKWMLGGERVAAVPDPGDLGGEPVPVEAPVDPSPPSSDPADAVRPDPAPDPVAAPPTRAVTTRPLGESETLLATALAEALGEDSSDESSDDAPLFDTAASPAPAPTRRSGPGRPTPSPEPAGPPESPEPTEEVAPSEPGFEGRIGRQVVLTPPPPPTREETPAQEPTPAREPEPPTRSPTPPPPPPPAEEPEDAGEPPGALALFSPSEPEAGPDPVVRRSRRRRPRRRPRGRRTVATLQADKLTSAAAAGMVSLVQQLLDLGTPVDVRNASGQTALQAALDAGQQGVVSVLLSRGADPDHLDPGQRHHLVLGN